MVSSYPSFDPSARGRRPRPDADMPGAALRHEQAQGECLAAPAGELDRVDVCLRLGAVAAEAGKMQEAAKALEEALALDSRCAEAYGALGMVRQRLQEYPQAISMYLKCLELDGDNLVALLGLFQCCCKMGSFAIIVRYLEIYLAAHPHDVAVLFCLATLYAREGKLLQAKESLATILALEPGKPEAVHLLRQVEAALAQA